MGRGGPLSGWSLVTAQLLSWEIGCLYPQATRTLGGAISLVWAQGQLPAALAELLVCSHLSNPCPGLRMDPQDLG